jgi:hypothetical protein
VAQSLVSDFSKEVKSGTSNSLPFATTYILYVVFGEPLSFGITSIAYGIIKDKQAAVAQRHKQEPSSSTVVYEAIYERSVEGVRTLAPFIARWHLRFTVTEAFK